MAFLGSVLNGKVIISMLQILNFKGLVIIPILVDSNSTENVTASFRENSTANFC
jgi:hypothetical protein